MPSSEGLVGMIDIVIAEGGNLYATIQGDKWRYCLKSDNSSYPHHAQFLLAAKAARMKARLEGEKKMVDVAAKDTYYLDRTTIT